MRFLFRWRTNELDAALEVEGALAAQSRSSTKVIVQPLGEVGHLAEALGQRVVVVVDASRRSSVSAMNDRGGAGAARPIADDLLDWRLRHARAVLLRVDLAVAPHLDAQPLGQRVDHRGAHAVQAAGDSCSRRRRTCRRRAASVMTTSSAGLLARFGCMSTGMPRPLSLDGHRSHRRGS